MGGGGGGIKKGGAGFEIFLHFYMHDGDFPAVDCSLAVRFSRREGVICVLL